jgi:YD repeat-containing protein
MTTIEIDTRTIPGIGEVRWQLDDEGHVITVTDAEGEIQARMCIGDGATARDVFRHPFARPGVPDLFARHEAHTAA